MRNRRVRTLLLLALAALLAHAPALSGLSPGALPSTGDTLGAFAPWHEFARQSLRGGIVPLWNPHLYGGLPFAANGQSALFYPPTYGHFLLPENGALWLFAWAHSVFLMAGAYALARTLGLKRRAAFLVALLLGWGNATPAHLFGGHLTFLPTRAFWPWQGFFLLRLLRDFRPRDAIAWAACVALGLAAGAPQLWLFGMLFNALIVAAWMGRQLLSRGEKKALRLAPLGLALGLTILWCAPVLLPLRELKAWSAHGDALSFAEVTGLSATPRSLFRLLLNGFFGGNSFVMWSLPSNPGEDAASLGLAPFLLAFLAPFLAPRSRLARYLCWGGAGAILLSLGDATPLYRWLYDHVALFQITRVPARWLELWALAAALLAGLGFDTLLRRPARAPRLQRAWIGAALGCAALLIYVLAARAPWERGAQIVAHALNLAPSQRPELAVSLQSDAALSCVLAGATLGTLAYFWRRGLTTPRATTLLLALLGAEPLMQFWLATRIAPPEVVAAAQIPPSLTRFYRPGQRWIVRAPFQQLNAPLSAGMDALNGYEPFGSRPFFQLANAAQGQIEFSADFQPRQMSPLWRVMGASYLLWKPKFPGDGPRGFAGKTVARAGEWRLNSLEDGLKPWPRAYLTRDFVRSNQPFKELLTRAARRFEGAPPVVLPRDFPAFYVAPLESVAAPGARFETLRALKQTPDVRVWQTQTTRETVFVHNETMAPGWKAFADDKPMPIYLANGIFLGVSVPAGTRRVALIYDSQTLRFALFLGLCGLSLAAFCWAQTASKKR